MKLALPLPLGRSAGETSSIATSRAVGRLTRPGKPPAELDMVLIWSAMALLLLGLVMVYSSSIATAEGSDFTGHRSSYFLVRHSTFLMIGVVAGTLAFQLPVRVWQQCAPWLFGIGVLLLVAVLVPNLGREVNGARRWLPLGPLNLQPSELMKLFVALYAADYTVRKLPYMSSLRRAIHQMQIGRAHV